MHLPRCSTLAALVVLESTASTNDELLARAAAGAPEFTVVVTTDQTAGRGRLGREWIAPPGETIAASVLLRPRLPGGGPLAMDRWGWIPLLAGLAMTRSVHTLLPERNVSLKWPNDVLVGGRKISGILAEIIPVGGGLALGAGLNLTIPADRLPTRTSTSLTIEAEGNRLPRDDELVDLALSTWLEELSSLYADFLRHDGDEAGSGIRRQVIEACGSIGQRVNVHLPGGSDLIGTATDIDATGRIMIETEADGHLEAVAAGDVTHLRYE
ncbi:MAG: biofilm synthesis protein PgaB [Microbacteriaceae bacterium]|jgi:BirA family biotin operon repressor/biotin-[acetyl-CoA-carboxylase] ligase|nr:biofilm synthesis protein PgaB [Microbacteriaceae bacterium]HEV7957466.1 biotin--[acetyl-CoA-carboxylase] ligase [Marisediminicola sp.]